MLWIQDSLRMSYPLPNAYINTIKLAYFDILQSEKITRMNHKPVGRKHNNSFNLGCVHATKEVTGWSCSGIQALKIGCHFSFHQTSVTFIAYNVGLMNLQSTMKNSLNLGKYNNNTRSYSSQRYN